MILILGKDGEFDPFEDKNLKAGVNIKPEPETADLLRLFKK